MNALYAQLILVAHNLLNVWLDAYKIKRALKKNIPKSVRHGVNFAAYSITVGLIIWWQHSGVWEAIVFALSAFFQRQLTFDIPLNLRRGLSIWYMSTDKPPKSWWDRVEYSLVGSNGKAITIIYFFLWAASIAIEIVFL